MPLAVTREKYGSAQCPRRKVFHLVHASGGRIQSFSAVKLQRFCNQERARSGLLQPVHASAGNGSGPQKKQWQRESTEQPDGLSQLLAEHRDLLEVIVEQTVEQRLDIW